MIKFLNICLVNLSQRLKDLTRIKKIVLFGFQDLGSIIET